MLSITSKSYSQPIIIQASTPFVPKLGTKTGKICATSSVNQMAVGATLTTFANTVSSRTRCGEIYTTIKSASLTVWLTSLLARVTL